MSPRSFGHKQRTKLLYQRWISECSNTKSICSFGHSPVVLCCCTLGTACLCLCLRCAYCNHHIVCVGHIKMLRNPFYGAAVRERCNAARRRRTEEEKASIWCRVRNSVSCFLWANGLFLRNNCCWNLFGRKYWKESIYYVSESRNIDRRILW